AYVDAGRARPGLHSHRPRQGPDGACSRLSPRVAQCHNPGADRSGIAVWRDARRSHRDRDDFFLAGYWTADSTSHLEPRLLPGAGMHPGDWTDLRAGEFPHRPDVLGTEPAHPAVAWFKQSGHCLNHVLVKKEHA